MFTKVKELFQKETVCCIAFLLAVISIFFVSPSKNYISYIDFRVLALLFCLMAVVRGFSSIGVFTRLGTMLLTHVHSPDAVGTFHFPVLFLQHAYHQ